MDVISSIYKRNISNNTDISKMLDFIKVEQHDATGKFYFSNPYKLNTDLGYSNLLEISESSYKEIIYANKETYYYKITNMFVNRRDAEERRWLLCVLILNKYNTYDAARQQMLTVVNRRV